MIVLMNRVMFEFCGVEYVEEMKKIEQDEEEKKSWKGQVKMINDLRKEGINRTAFAPPIVTHNDDFILSQTGAIVLFLAELFPALKPKNILQMARARMVFLHKI